MNKKYIAIGVIVAVVVAIVAFRSPNFSKDIVQTEKSKTVTDKKKHKETKIVEKKNKDGSSETDTTIIEDGTSEKKQEVSKKKETKIADTSRKVSIYILGGARISDIGWSSLPPFVYGAHVSVTVLGPLSVGAWGLNNSTAGVSVGITF